MELTDSSQTDVAIDAGTVSEHGKIVGDVSVDVRELDDITITPQKKGESATTAPTSLRRSSQSLR